MFHQIASVIKLRKSLDYLPVILLLFTSISIASPSIIPPRNINLLWNKSCGQAASPELITGTPNKKGDNYTSGQKAVIRNFVKTVYDGIATANLEKLFKSPTIGPYQTHLKIPVFPENVNTHEGTPRTKRQIKKHKKTSKSKDEKKKKRKNSNKKVTKHPTKREDKPKKKHHKGECPLQLIKLNLTIFARYFDEMRENEINRNIYEFLDHQAEELHHLRCYMMTPHDSYEITFDDSYFSVGSGTVAARYYVIVRDYIQYLKKFNSCRHYSS